MRRIGRMRRIGLTGGIGSGKSTAAKLMRKRGIAVIDLDELSRAVLDQPGPGLDEAIARFGPEYVNECGTMDRAALARLVFADPAARTDLERIVLARVDEGVQKAEERASAAGEEVIVHDSPLLLDHRREGEYDAVISVIAPVEQRIERVMRSRGRDRAYVESIIAAQINDDERRERSDVVIDNSGSIAELDEQVAATLEQLLRAPH